MKRDRVTSLMVILSVMGCVSDQGTTEPGLDSAPASAAAFAVSYVARNLGALPGQPAGGSASDINDFRHVVGTTSFGADQARAFLWKSGTMTNLGTLGGGWSTASAINNSGTVVGSSVRRDGKVRAFRWSNGTLTGLGTLGGSRSEATDINARGHIVGWSYLTGDPRPHPDAEPIAHAFLWRDGTMIDLGTLGGLESQATGINDLGHVIGSSVTKGGATHAFLWKDGVMTDLGGGNQSTYFIQAEGINALDLVVGTGVSNFEIHAFLWKKGVTRDLGRFGGTAALALDVNAAGRMVGGVDPPQSLRRAFTHKDGVTTLLPTLPGGRTNEALAINKSGDIVGWSEGRALRVNRPTMWIKQQDKAPPGTLVDEGGFAR